MWCNLLLSHPQVTLPVYLNDTHSELLISLNFAAKELAPNGDHCYYERGVALLFFPL